MVLTTLLLNQVRDDIKTDLENNVTYGAVGTDSTTPTAADTTLGTEVFRDTVDDVDTSGSNTVTVSLRVLTTEANGNTLVEIGLLDAAAAGNLWTHNTFTAITKTVDIQLYLDTTFTIAVTEG